MENTQETANVGIIGFEDIMEDYEPSKNKSVKFITKYEKTALLAARRQQLSNNAPTMLTEDEIKKHKVNITSIYQIADIEYVLDKIPLLIRRKMPDGSYEYWKTEDLIKLD